MDTRPTNTDYSDPRWYWPSWKFHLPLDALFDDLYDQYNTLPMPIQDPTAFHHDVSEITAAAATIEEFHVLMGKRRTQRIQELRKCWDAVSIRIATYPPVLQGDADEVAASERWSAFLHLSREFSFDAIARYFSLYTHKSTALPLASGSQPSPTATSTTSMASTTLHSPNSPPTTSSTSTRPRKRSYSDVESESPGEQHSINPDVKRFCSQQPNTCSGEGLDDLTTAGTPAKEGRPQARRSGRIAARARYPDTRPRTLT